MSRIHAEAFKAVIIAAEAAYPEECCGLLIGRRGATNRGSANMIEITRTVAAENVASTNRRKRFEIDPALRLRTMRALTSSPDAIVGHYHSHPDRPASPSPSDVAMAYEPDLLWLITAVVKGRAAETAAFVIKQGRIRRMDLAVVGWAPLSGEALRGGENPHRREDEGCSEA